MSRMERVHAALYAALICVLVASGALFLSQFLASEKFWEHFTLIYLGALVVYTWYLFALLLVHDVKPRQYETYDGGKIAVLIPCYNEEPDLVEESIRTVLAAYGNKQVIVIDDGSTNGVRSRLRELAGEVPITLHEFEQNAGKREALFHATTHMLDDDVEYVVTIDSDTLLATDALVRVVEPLLDPTIGASTGDVQLLNERQNLLTRMIGTYYWIGLNIYKQAQSVIRSVVCCSGCLAAYNAPLLRDIIGEFANQRFLGERCTHSEDRHLTNLVLKQQRRWKRGYVRGSLFTLLYAWRVKKLLWLQILVWDLSAPFLAFGLRIGLIVVIIGNPTVFVTAILPSWLMLLLVRYAFVPLRAPNKLLGLFLYMFFYEGVLYWLNLWALFTVRNKSWVTRTSTAQA